MSIKPISHTLVLPLHLNVQKKLSAVFCTSFAYLSSCLGSAGAPPRLSGLARWSDRNFKWLLVAPAVLLILNRQRDVVSAVTRFLRRAYPQRLNPVNQTAVTMMLFGMINWTFTWLRPGGAMSYAAFAEEVIGMLERGLASGEVAGAKT